MIAINTNKCYNFVYQILKVLFGNGSVSLKNSVVPPVYSRIALDIATRIAEGDLKEKSKIYGRSVMSSEYGVSPETIRRALRLLSDMEIVDIRQNSGAVILSKEKAKQYIARFNEHEDIRTLQRQLKDMLSEQENLNRRITEITASIINKNERFSKINPFQIYEAEVNPEASVLGKTLAELKFWQETGATIIAIRREDKIILSPGPYAVLMQLDRLIFVGDIACIDAVDKFING